MTLTDFFGFLAVFAFFLSLCLVLIPCNFFPVTFSLLSKCYLKDVDDEVIFFLFIINKTEALGSLIVWLGTNGKIVFKRISESFRIFFSEISFLVSPYFQVNFQVNFNQRLTYFFIFLDRVVCLLFILNKKFRTTKILVLRNILSAPVSCMFNLPQIVISIINNF